MLIKLVHCSISIKSWIMELKHFPYEFHGWSKWNDSWLEHGFLRWMHLRQVMNRLLKWDLYLSVPAIFFEYVIIIRGIVLIGRIRIDSVAVSFPIDIFHFAHITYIFNRKAFVLFHYQPRPTPYFHATPPFTASNCEHAANGEILWNRLKH